jgi:hypothetical protein
MWTEIGSSSTGGASTFYMYYPLEVFFPGIWSDQSEFWKIDSTGVITMNLGQVALQNAIAYQATGTNISDGLTACGACTGIELALMVRRITNNVEQIHAQIPA